jgi:predicted ATP-grasp superfamily ATP-dependent carboligase
MSCLRAGLRPLAIDLYADTDTAACCESRRVDAADYPNAILAELERFPPLPVLWTGGLEAHPTLLATIAERQPLIGSPPESTRLATDPERFVQTIVGAGLSAPRMLTSSEPLPDGRWLSKPVGGAGGIGIREITTAVPDASRFYQELVEGSPSSAVFLASTPRSGGLQIDLLACTRQLIGADWLHAPPFAYCGNIAPIAIEDDEVLHAISIAGRVVADSFGLLGLFGLDFMIPDSGAPIFLEVNPRYTASVECIELARDISVVDLHLRACRGEPVEAPAATLPVSTSTRVAGKAVVYAEHDATFTPPNADALRELELRGGSLADVPRAGEPISAGAPMFTILCDAADENDAIIRLHKLLGIVRPRLEDDQR